MEVQNSPFQRFYMKSITHPPFLTKIIAYLNQCHQIKKPLIIFPTQLSIDYFGLLLKQVAGQYQTTCIALDQLILSHSKLKLLPNLPLLTKLHALSGEILNRKESFEQFYGWGKSLLADYNQIEHYLVDDDALFISLIAYKKLTMDSVVDEFFWEALPLLYKAFRRKLIEEKSGYRGLCYRLAEPLLETIGPYEAFLVVGFNLLTPVEEQFIKECSRLVLTTFFWDADTHYLDNPINVAGYYLREHKSKWLGKSFAVDTYFNDEAKKVFLIETPTTVAQVEALVSTLEAKTNDGRAKFLPSQSAIIVSGNEVLIPLLDQLSNLSIPLHVSLSYPFNATVIYSLATQLAQVWETAMDHPNEQLPNHMANVLVLCYPFIAQSVQAEFAAVVSRFEKDFLSYFQKCLTDLEKRFIKNDTFFLKLHKQALSHLLEYIHSLAVAKANCSITFFLNSLKSSKLLFHEHNPLTGLYILDIEQAYNVDFEHLFFLNMNEAHFPKPSYNDSCLPYDLRVDFGLPWLATIREHQTAYGFYRLLQRSQNSYCYYSQKNNIDTSTEISRLLIQLKLDSKLKIIEDHYSINFLPKSIAPIFIEKDERVMALLSKFCAEEKLNRTSLTPSGLIAYLSCPLQFYFKYLIELKQTNFSKEADNSIQLGTLFHKVIASIYQPFLGKQIDKEKITSLKPDIQAKIREAIAAQKREGLSPTFMHGLLDKILARILDLDYANAPFTLVGVELGIETSIRLNVMIDKKISLKGVIDRIEKHDDLIRIIDYKTGLSNNKISDIASIFDSTKIKKHKAIFQSFFYAWLFNEIYGPTYRASIKPYLIQIRELFLEDYKDKVGIFLQESNNGKKYKRIENFLLYAKSFEEGLKELLTEIFNPLIPFAQTEDLEICNHCPYKAICQRD